MNVYLQGLSAGLAYVAPIGMQNIFVINQALTRRRKWGLLTALIVVFFDISLALACFFGAGLLMAKIPILEKVILGLGSLVVLWIGFSLLRSKPDPLGDTEVKHLGLWKIISSACVVTWANPQALIDGTMFIGAFRASLPPGTDGEFIAGVMSASLLWFTGLSLVISFLRHRLDEKVLLWINRISGCIILFYGLKLVLSFFRHVF